MAIAHQYKISGISETRFKEWKYKRLISNSTSGTEKYVINRISGEMNIFHLIEKDYQPTIDGWRSYPTLTELEAEIAQGIVIEFGGEWHGRFCNK